MILGVIVFSILQATKASAATLNISNADELRQALAPPISPNTTLSLAPGTYSGPFEISNANQLTLTSQTNPPAEIKCSAPVTGWALYSGSIFRAKVTTPVSQVMDNGEFLLNARYPQTGFLKLDKNSVNLNSLTLKSSDYTQLTTQGILGAGLVLRNVDFWYDSSTIQSLNDTTQSFNLSSPTRYLSQADWGYFVTNKLWMMTYPSSWAFDPAESMLYVWKPDNTKPSDNEIEYSNSNDCLTLNHTDQLNISNLKITNAGGNAVVLNEVNGATFKNVTLKNISNFGFLLNHSRGFILSNSSVSETGNNAVSEYDFSPLPDCSGLENCSGNIIEQNHFSFIGTALGPHPFSAAVQLFGTYGTGTQIHDNIFANVAYIGVYSPTESKVIHNTFIRNCLLADDCGAIYVSARGPNVTVDSNVIYGTESNTDGKPVGRGPYNDAGIYMDDDASGMIITQNKILGGRQGINLHNAHDNLITQNEILNASYAAISAREDTIEQRFDSATMKWVPVLNANGVTEPSMKRNIFQGNVFNDQIGIPLFHLYSNQDSATCSGLCTFQRSFDLSQNNTYHPYLPSDVAHFETYNAATKVTVLKELPLEEVQAAHLTIPVLVP